MPGDEESQVDYNALAAKFLLNTASKKAKAKSWLQASLPDEPESEPSTTQDAEIISDDEYAGIGAPKKSKVNALANRQLANANDQMRKTLMSKKAYGKYQHGQTNGLEASKPMPKQARRTADSESEDEGGKGKGKSMKAVERKLAADLSDEESRVFNSKKRPLSYADEIIASRARKKKIKVKG